MKKEINYDSLVTVVKNMTEKDAQFKFFLHACEEGEFEICQACLDAGININICESYHKETILTLLIMRKKLKLEVLDWLISKGLDINKGDISDTKPLSRACEEGNFEIVEYLVKKGAIIKETDLYYAVKSDSYEVVKLLLKSGISIDEKYWKKLLTYAVEYAKNNKIVELILEYGTSPDFYTAFFYSEITPLHHVVREKNIQIASLLLEYGACVNALIKSDGLIKDYKGALTAMDIAIFNKDIEMQKLLSKYGGKESSKDEKISFLIEHYNDTDAYSIVKELIKS